MFAAVKDECGIDAADAAKATLARQVLAWAEREAPSKIKIRPRVEESFVTRGSLHILADDLRVGWHPEFRERLAAVLVAEGGVKV